MFSIMLYNSTFKHTFLGVYMLKKIIFSLFILSSLIQAEDFEQTIEDKYAACEKHMMNV